VTAIPDLPAFVLTIQQPWAWALIYGDPPKDVENRTWRLSQPSVILVHAGKTIDFTAWKLMGRLGIEPPITSKLVTGGIIGAVTVNRCIRDSPSRWADPGQWHWIVENPVPLEQPVTWRGRPGLFRPPAMWRAAFGGQMM
jgi:hypothetical protein